MLDCAGLFAALEPPDACLDEDCLDGPRDMAGHRDRPVEVLLGSALTEMALTFEGIPGSMHAGRTRSSCSRVTAQHPKGTEIANTRQLSVVSAEELADIAHALGIAQIDPARLGASIVVEGLPDFTHLPPAARLQGPSGVTLVVDMENRPCVYPARSLEQTHPGHGKGFRLRRAIVGALPCGWNGPGCSVLVIRSACTSPINPSGPALKRPLPAPVVLKVAPALPFGNLEAAEPTLEARVMSEMRPCAGCKHRIRQCIPPAGGTGRSPPWLTNPISKSHARRKKPIQQIGEALGIPNEHLLPYGHDKAKIGQDFINAVQDRKDGKLILVTAINPTPAGEGKTTTTVGLGDGLNRIGKNATICIREASLGPNFGMKGGAAGGGYAQVVPMEDMNLHFTGDFHAITSAHSLLSAMIDNHIYWGNEQEIDVRRVVWRRVVDMNDRALRQITASLGGVANGFPREAGFDITVASEVMAILCLANDLEDLQKRLGDMIVAYRRDRSPGLRATSRPTAR